MQATVQIVETHWTKQSRGAPNARRRNAVPEIFKAPDGGEESSLRFHHVYCSEFRDFSPQSTLTMDCSKKLAQQYRFTLEATEEGLTILFFGIPGASTSGKPTDSVLPRPNAWLQIVGNRRIGHEEWSYYKLVYNIACGKPAAVNALFATPPVKRLDHERRLW